MAVGGATTGTVTIGAFSVLLFESTAAGTAAIGTVAFFSSLTIDLGTVLLGIAGGEVNCFDSAATGDFVSLLIVVVADGGVFTFVTSDVATVGAGDNDDLIEEDTGAVAAAGTTGVVGVSVI